MPGAISISMKVLWYTEDGSHEKKHNHYWKRVHWLAKVISSSGIPLKFTSSMC